MASDEDKPKPKLPPPPQIGGSSEGSGSRLAPPAIGKGKTEARKVGIDTSFIDGLTAGLVEVDPEAPSPARRDPDAASGTIGASADDAAEQSTAESDAVTQGTDAKKAAAEPDDDELEQLPTRALPAMDEDGEVAAKPRGQAPKKEEDAAAAAGAPSPSVAAGEVPPSAPLTATKLPRSWLIGAAASLMGLAVLWRVCGGSGTPDPASEPGDRVAAIDSADEGRADEAGAMAGGAGAEAGEHEDQAVGGGGRDHADGAEADEADGAQAAAATDAEMDAEADAEAEAESAAGAGDTEDILQIEPSDDADAARAESAGGSQGSHKSLPASSSSADRAAEDEMSAEELLRAAKEAYAKGKARDAYRLANLSNQKQKSDDALEMKAKAACRMKNKDLAKSAFKALPLGEKRREVRQACRESDIRLGL